MPVDEEPPVLLTATDVPRLLEELPVGARAGKPVTCRGTVRKRAAKRPVAVTAKALGVV